MRALLDARLSEWGARLSPALYEDALAYLIETAWELSLRYRPTSDLAYSTYSRRILRARVVDWYRQTFRDGRYVRDVVEVSLSTLADEDDDEAPFLDRHRSERDELHRHASDPMEEVLTYVALAS